MILPMSGRWWNGRRRYGVAVLAVFLTFGSVNAALAGDDPRRRCQAAKLAATATVCRSMLRCHSSAVVTGKAADPACLAGARTALVSAFTQIESRGGCATVADSAAVQGVIDTSVREIAGKLRPRPESSKCAARKLTYVASGTSSLLRAYGKQKKNPALDKLGVLESRIRVEIADGFAAADTSSGCLTTGDFGSIDAQVYQLTGNLVELLWPLGISGVTFDRPKGWSLHAVELIRSNGRHFEYTNFGGQYFHGGFPPAGGAYIRVTRLPVEPLQSFIARRRLERQVLEREYFQIAGEAVTGVTYADVYDEFTDIDIEEYFKHGNFIYLFHLNVRQGDPLLSAHRGALVHMLSSLRFTDGSGGE